MCYTYCSGSHSQSCTVPEKSTGRYKGNKPSIASCKHLTEAATGNYPACCARLTPQSGSQTSFLQLKSLDSSLCRMQFYRIQAKLIPRGVFCYFLFWLPLLVMEYDLILMGTVENKPPRKIGSQLRHSQPLSREEIVCLWYLGHKAGHLN